jgi:hypothetical protein
MIDEYKSVPLLSDAEHVELYESYAAEYFVDGAWISYWDFYSKLNDEFAFTLDACATRHNALCSKFYTVEDDGLAQDWSGEVVYCSPFYNRDFPDWLVKCAMEGSFGVRVVLLAAYKPEDSWWSLVDNSRVFKFSHRIDMPGAAVHGVEHPVCYIVFGGVNE